MSDEHGLRCSLAFEMTERRMTVRELCDGAGVHAGAVTRLRRNHFAMLDAATFEKICRFLKVQPGEILHLEPDLDD